MPDPLFTLAIVAMAVGAVSILLARLIPDEYDRLKPDPAPIRRPGPR